MGAHNAILKRFYFKETKQTNSDNTQGSSRATTCCKFLLLVACGSKRVEAPWAQDNRANKHHLHCKWLPSCLHILLKPESPIRDGASSLKSLVALVSVRLAASKKGTCRKLPVRGAEQ
eukprot:3296551-Amphidinium_carterae.1